MGLKLTIAQRGGRHTCEGPEAQGQAELLWVLEEQLTPLWRLWKFLGEVKPQDMSRCGGDRTRIFCVGRRVLYHYYHQGSPCNRLMGWLPEVGGEEWAKWMKVVKRCKLLAIR